MIKEQDIKDLYQVTAFLGGLACIMEDWKLDATAHSIELTRVSLANIIDRLEKEYESERA